MRVYLGGIEVNIEFDEILYMTSQGIIKKIDGKYQIQKDSDFKFLFSKDTSINKKIAYLNGLIDAKFKCSICKKEHSYCISPYIDENGEVDFNKVVCVCKECRKAKLQKRDIVKPIYKKHISWKKELSIINANIKTFSVEEDHVKEYIDICKKIVLLEQYSKLVLPKRDLSNVEFLDKDVNINNRKIKRRVRENLYEISNRKCPVCGEKVYFKDFTIDHIIARKLGGKDNTSNFIGMCKHCNQAKGHKSVIEFLSTTEMKFVPDKILKLASVQQSNSKIELEKLHKEKEKLENKPIRTSHKNKRKNNNKKNKNFKKIY